MRNTVIGVFENKVDAEEAEHQLIKNGFSSQDIDFSYNQEDYGNKEYTDYSNKETMKEKEDDKISRFFNNLFGSSDEAKYYTAAARHGTMLTVHTKSKEKARLAADIMDECGAVNANERGKEYYSGKKEINPRVNEEHLEPSYNKPKDFSKEDTINVVEENLEVGKREVESGGVRIHSRIVERPVEENLRLRSEHVYVERNPVNRPATEADMANFKEGTIETTEREEVPIIGKKAKVVEEVKLKKEVEERSETIRESVRKQDVDVERMKKDKEKIKNKK